jgi:hypothetical protein
VSPINIDWSAILPLNGSRAEGFEELCAQLARFESPVGSRFERNGPPDAGVECFAALSDGSEWGWQAKYFESLGDSQWSQLDESVKTALEKHPRLARYFVCAPGDLPDARMEGRKSARERWNDHVQKWSGWASARSMAVDFVYWGSHELLDRLSLPQHVGRVRFWFDARAFDGAWFKARLDEAIKTAGPRYTPEIHVDLPIAKEFEAFGRTEWFFDEVKAHARSLRKKLESVRYSDPENPDAALDTSLSALSAGVRTVLTDLGTLTVQPTGVLPLRQIVEHVTSAESSADELERLLRDRERADDAEHPPAGGDIAGSSHRDRLRRCRAYLWELSADLRLAREHLDHWEHVANRSLMILKGAAGTGKTHLLCDVARQRVKASRPTVLLMGQRFVSLEPPWTQVMQQLDLDGLSAEEFVGALEAAAQAADSRALVLIDAMNEGAGRLLWPNHLAAFLAHLARSLWIGLVLVTRSSYEEILIPQEIRASAVTVTHEGFADHEYDATRTFFVYYGLELPSTPLLEPEFRNPLFLKTLCLGLNAKGERRLPRGFHGVTAVFSLYLEAINGRLASLLDFNPKHGLVG